MPIGIAESPKPTAAMLAKKEEWPESEENRRMSDEAVAKASPSRSRTVLAHRQRIDVPMAAAAEVTGRRMMQRMFVPPLIERRESEQPRNGTNGVFGPPRADERSVGTIVHENERADK